MRVLVTGAAGQVGRELVEVFERRGHDVVAADRAALDVSNRDSVLGAITGLAPDAVVHAAAYTGVDACESDIDAAFAVNALGTRYVADGARRSGAFLATFSTDYVFDGALGRPYHEWDEPNPLSVYGRSKLASEREAGPEALVVRTSWVCGRHGSNLVKTVLRLAAEGSPLRFVDDQRGCPTFAADLAGMVATLVEARRTGIHHVTNQGPATWFELAQAVVAATGREPSLVEPITTAELDPPRPAPRPAFSVLDNAALRLGGLPVLEDWHDPLERLVKELNQ